MKQQIALVDGKLQTFALIAEDENLEGKLEILMDTRKQGRYYIVLANFTDVLYSGYNYSKVQKLFYTAFGYHID